MKSQQKVIWITGASSGIGAALAKIYSRRGEKLILSSRRELALEKIKSECDQPENISILTLDLNDFDAADEIVKKAYEFFGSIDVIINNAGISQRSLIVDTQFDVF
ncbi:MAG TPA: short-chain dehydrogenase, partial [Flavobacteriaceae bacterium]|nr:short-chain dehydrogenase [Flavobacteriaceae bacterium]